MKNLKIAYLISLLVFIITDTILTNNPDSNIFIIILIQITLLLILFILPPLILYSQTKSKQLSIVALIISSIIIMINISMVFILPPGSLNNTSVLNDFFVGPFISLLTITLFYTLYNKYTSKFKYILPIILIIFTNYIIFTIFILDYTKYINSPINIVLPNINTLFIKFPLFVTICYLISYIIKERYQRISNHIDKNKLTLLFKIWDVILLVAMYIVAPGILIYEIITVGELASFALFVKNVILITLFNISILLILSLVNSEILNMKNTINQKDTLLFFILLLIISISFPITVINTSIYTVLFPITEIILLGVTVYKFHSIKNS